MSRIEDAVAKQLLLRAKVGEKKYGTTMERNDLSLKEWLQHLQEELLDACVYVEKLKQEIQYQEFELAEKRMEIIGRNGNDGLHYGKLNILDAEVTYETISGTEAAYVRRSPCSNHAYEENEETNN